MNLNKSEKYFEQNLRGLLESGYVDADPRAKYTDGEDATSTFITQVVEKYDISKGELPITETRHIAWKTGINEMLAIYQSQTNTQEGFERHGCDWWQPWMNEEGNIGRAYSHNLESHRPNEMKRDVVKVKRMILPKEKYEVKEIGMLNPIKKSIDGQVYKSNYRDYGEYVITDKFKKINDDNRDYVEVQFLNNGFITELRHDTLVRGSHPKNNYVRTLLNIGYMGDLKKNKNITKRELKFFQEMWRRMMVRCYDGTRSGYTDVFVDTRWHCFANFLEDVSNLPQYHLAKEFNFKGWHLDKDWNGSNCYSPETCVFLNSKDNATYRKSQINPIKIKEVGKPLLVVLSLKEIALKYRVSESTAGRWIVKGCNPDGNVLFEEIPIEEGYVYRYELSRNQVNELISELIQNKFSRRHMVSFFNWSNQNKKMLVECAYETLWSVREVNDKTYMDVTLIQRSSDVCTANHINKIQYVALMMMVAKHCGYECGSFMHVVQNYHIYNTHFDNAYELLRRIDILKQREKQSQPKLTLNVPDGTSFYNIKPSDFTLDDYYPITPQLKFQLAI